MTVAMPASCPDSGPGWQARLELAFVAGPDRTLLTRNRHRGPLLVQQPLYPENRVCHGCILHPPGGVVAGDRLQLLVGVEKEASALLTTPGATKFYRSAGATAVQEQKLRVQRGGVLEWFPMENILFPGGRVRLSTRIDLESGAHFMGWEIHCLGLPAGGARFAPGNLEARLALHRDHRPLLLERLRIRDEADLDRPAGLRGHPVSGTFLATDCDREMLAPLRTQLDRHPAALCGLTLTDELLVARYLGDSTMEARAIFQDLWTWLRPKLCGCAACPPRIWAT